MKWTRHKPDRYGDISGPQYVEIFVFAVLVSVLAALWVDLLIDGRLPF